MKIILRIITILLVAVVVSGVFYLVLNNSTIASGPEMGGGQAPVMTNTNRQNFQPMENHHGGDDSASLSRGLAGVAGTLAKLIAIAIIVLLLEKVISLFNKRPVATLQH